MSAAEYGFLFGLWTGLVVGGVSALLWAQSRERSARRKRKAISPPKRAVSQVDEKQLNRWLRGEL
jgi:gas vesicle protein